MKRASDLVSCRETSSLKVETGYVYELMRNGYKFPGICIQHAGYGGTGIHMFLLENGKCHPESMYEVVRELGKFVIAVE